jgi:hypothetical protein
MPMERLQILVTSEQREWLEAESERQNQPVTAVIRAAIDAARGVRPGSRRLAAVESLLGRIPGSQMPSPASLESRRKPTP